MFRKERSISYQDFCDAIAEGLGGDVIDNAVVRDGRRIAWMSENYISKVAEIADLVSDEGHPITRCYLLESIYGKGYQVWDKRLRRPIYRGRRFDAALKWALTYLPAYARSIRADD